MLLHDTFVSCDFSNVKFGGINLENVTFVNCKFSNVQFRPDNLGGPCHLSTAKFVECEFNNCVSLNSKIGEDNTLPAAIRIETMKTEDIGLM